MHLEKRKIFFSKTQQCRINYQDSLIKDVVRENDIIVNDPSYADIIIFSATCACSMSQIALTLSYMDEILKQVKNRDKVTTYLTGCLTRSFRYENELLSNIEKWIQENIDFIVPQNEPYKMLDLLYPNSKFSNMQNCFGDIVGYGDNTVDLYISNGCNNRCSFCKINYQTWPLTSVDIATTKYNIDRLNEEYKISCLTFIGANLAQYGYDLDGQYHLPEIIEYVENKENITSIFLGGFAVSDAVRLGFHQVLRDSTKIVGFGGSLESGSNRILKLMNKGITIEEYIDFIQKIRSKKEKKLYLSIISGFPTETLEDIKLTLKAIEEIKPNCIDICRYTDSSMIPSHNYEQLPPSIIQEHTRIYSKVLQRKRVRSTIQLYGYKYNGKY